MNSFFKKVILHSGTIILFSSNLSLALDPKPSLDVIKQKAALAGNDVHTKSLRELLELSPSRRVLKHVGHDGVERASLVIQGKQILENTNGSNKSPSISQVEEELASLYWAKQDVLVSELFALKVGDQLMLQEKLKQAIKERYAGKSAALLLFAQDIQTEKSFLDGFFTKLMRLSAAKQTLHAGPERDDFMQRLKVLYEQNAAMSQTLQRFFDIIDTALTL